MVEPEFVLGGLKAVFDRPAMSFDLDQSFDARSGRTPGREEGHIAVGDVAADQQTPRPWAGSLVVIFGRVEISQFAIGPVVQSCAFGSFASRQAFPWRRIKRVRDF